jgi:hypothetical protein
MEKAGQSEAKTMLALERAKTKVQKAEQRVAKAPGRNGFRGRFSSLFSAI